MNFDTCLVEFENYVKNYDLTILENKYKYEHTFRVVDYAKIICENENFNDDEKYYALVACLLHDIARFEEWTKYQSWSKIDHGNLGYEILNTNDYILKYVDEKNKNVILDSVKYHNKMEIPDLLEPLTKKILRVVRDADKLDILNTQYNPYNEKSLTLNYDFDTKHDIDDEIMQNFINEKMLPFNQVKNVTEDIIYYLSYIYDINYRSSFKVIYNLNVLDIKLELLKKVLKDEEKYKIIELKIKDYLESNIKL